MNPQTKQQLGTTTLAIILACSSFLVFSGIAAGWARDTLRMAAREGLIQEPPW